MKNTNRKITIKLTNDEMFTLVEMLESFCEINAESIDNCDDADEIENLQSIHNDYETLTTKLIELYNENI